MPAFVKTPKDEKRWAKAKKAVESSRKISEGSFVDNDWALVNHIYQKMAKTDLLSELNIQEHHLVKSNDKSDYEGESYENDDYLNEQDVPDLSEDSEPIDVETEGAPVDPEDESMSEASGKTSAQKRVGRQYIEPTPEQLNALRVHTIPQEMRTRQRAAMEADATTNPEQFHHGSVVAAALDHYKGHNDAYGELVSSPQYKNAPLAEKMKMDRQFAENWRKDNPSHALEGMRNAIKGHERGLEGKQFYRQSKAADIRNILEGGALGSGLETVSGREGIQQAGGIEDDMGPTGVSTDRDQITSFAINNPEFVNKLREKYDVKNLPSAEELEYQRGAFKGSGDIRRLLGKEPAMDQQVNNFFNHYSPLIDSAKRKTISYLKSQNVPITEDSIEADVLTEVGMHGLIQAINDYKHDNPEGKKFKNWASTKIGGLMRTAMQQFNKIPPEVRKMKAKHDEEIKMKGVAPSVKAPEQKSPDLKSLPSSLQSLFKPKTEEQAPIVKQPESGAQASPSSAMTSTEPQQVKPAEIKDASSIIHSSNHPQKTTIIRRLKSAQASKPMLQPTTTPTATKPEGFRSFFDEDED